MKRNLKRSSELYEMELRNMRTGDVAVVTLRADARLEELSPKIKLALSLPLVIVKPPAGLSTPAMYRKLDELDGNAIAGVQFDIYAVREDGTAGDIVSTMVTDDDGVAMSADLLVGDYLVKEHENPVGYKYDLWSEKITVVMDETINRTVKNMPLQGNIRIIKTDSETKKGLPGAVFTVTRISGLPSHNGEDVGEIVAVLTTDENGFAETPLLTWGEYKVVETHVPDDYIDDGYEITVKVPGE